MFKKKVFYFRMPPFLRAGVKKKGLVFGGKKQSQEKTSCFWVMEFDEIMQQVLACPEVLSTVIGLDVFGEQSTTTGKRQRLWKPRKDYYESAFWHIVANPSNQDPQSFDGRCFRRRFRVPYSVFLQLVDFAEALGFDRRPVDAAGKNGAPLEIKILAVLQLLGRGLCFDDVALTTNISEEVIRVFFHDFIDKFVHKYYHDFIKVPEGAALGKCLAEYQALGFPGAVGSMDCVHVRWDMCPFSLTNLCKGKEGYQTIAFNVTVDHNRLIMASSRIFLGTFNDKSIVKFDKYATNLHEKRSFTDVTYNLFTDNGEEVERHDPYIIVDGGYLNWPCLMTMFKSSSKPEEIAWSKRMESVRKDVECTFGILKQRFQILKKGIKLHTLQHIENIFYMCCILHNILLVHDGLDKQWMDSDSKEFNEDPGIQRIQYIPRPLLAGEEDVQVEVLNDFHSLRAALVNDFAYRKRNNLLRW